MRRIITITALPLLLAACQGTASVPTSPGAQTSFLEKARAPVPFTGEPLPAARATFSKPNVPDGKGPPSVTWIFASNGQRDNVDVYDAKTLKMISQCSCTGVGLAVSPLSGDLAVGTTSVVDVFHVRSDRIKQFATLKLSQGPYAVGLAYDEKGDLYVANAGGNAIDFFKATEIEAGGGSPARTLFTSHLADIAYLAADDRRLFADGANVYNQQMLVSVDKRTGADTILQAIGSGLLPEGIALDREEGLILNTIGNPDTLSVFKKPWTGSPASSFVYGSSAVNGYYTGISLNKAQDTLWAGNFTFLNVSHAVGNLQANSYPLGSVGRSTAGIAGEYYDSIAADPQGK